MIATPRTAPRLPSPLPPNTATPHFAQPLRHTGYIVGGCPQHTSRTASKQPASNGPFLCCPGCEVWCVSMSQHVTACHSVWQLPPGAMQEEAAAGLDQTAAHRPTLFQAGLAGLGASLTFGASFLPSCTHTHMNMQPHRPGLVSAHNQVSAWCCCTARVLLSSTGGLIPGICTWILARHLQVFHGDTVEAQADAKPG